MRPSFNTIVFNASGLAIAVFVAGYMASSFFHVETIERCTARYGNGQQFSLRTAQGAPLSPLELQARLPVREWGVLHRSRVVEANDKKASFLQIALGPMQPKDAAEEVAVAEPERDGVGFIWQPSNLAGRKSACLSYRLFIPKDFSFEKQGTLPALFALSEADTVDSPQPSAGFISRLGWQRGGGLGLELRSPSSPGQWLLPRRWVWPQNQWIEVEQEVVLNTPEKANGLIRVFANGGLVIDEQNLNLGAQTDLAISGVVADVGYHGDKGGPAGRITLSPFVVQAQ